MADYDDKEIGTLFPTRFGIPTGGANERKMLDNVQGASGIRKKVRDNPDGSTTRLTTRAGMPVFVTEDSQKTGEEILLKSYMESGQLQWTYPGEDNPDRNNPAKWRIDTINPSSDWLGEVNLSASPIGKQTKTQPTPIDTHVIRDNIDSIAIGFKQSDDSFTNAQNQEERGPYTIMKKVVCGIFQPPMFSGKMRLFMQAKYGSPIPKSGFDFTVDLAGSSATLHYANQAKPDMPTMQIGFWSHFTTGLFTADGYRYYVLKITDGSGTSVNVHGVPVYPSKAGKAIVRKLRNGKIFGTEEIKKAEAYVFSDAEIATNETFLIGSFNAGECGVGFGVGRTLAWGWKFNWSGNKARIVRINEVGDELTNTLDGRAKEVYLEISRTDVFDGIESGKWTVTGSTSATSNWLDGWGSFNIFAPETETSTTLALYSLQVSWNTVAPYAFTSVPVYGYFDDDDIWQTVRLTRHPSETVTTYEQESSGLVFGTLYESYNEADYKYNGYPDIDNNTYAKRASNGAATYEKRTIPAGNYESFDVSVAGATVYGWRKRGDYRHRDWISAPTGQTHFDETGNMPRDYEGENIGQPRIAEYLAVEDYVDSVSGGAGYFGYFSSYAFDKYHKNNTWGSSQTVVTTLGGFDYFDRWALVIPSGDCNSVHIARNSANIRVKTSETSVSWSIGSNHITTINQLAGYQIPPATEHSFELPFTYINLFSEFGASSSDYVPPIIVIDDQTTISAWSKTIDNIGGTPSGSYETLFNVESTYPFYNGEMNFFESVGGKYRGSEGYINYAEQMSGLFVGWY